jgi:hypothetical protein
MKFTPMIENEYCTVLVIALYEGGAEQGESNVVREEEDGLSTPDNNSRQNWHARSQQ